MVTLISSRLMPEFSDSNMKMYKIDGWFIKFRGVEVTCFVIIEMITFIFVPMHIEVNIDIGFLIHTIWQILKNFIEAFH